MESREIEFRDAVAIVPVLGVILVLAFYPQFLLKRSEQTTKSTIATAQALTGGPHRLYTYGQIRSGWTAYAPLKTASTNTP